MTLRSVFVSLLLLLAPATKGGERWILISGTAGDFHTDARLFNPSFEKEILVHAAFLASNGAQTGTSFTLPRRQMRVLNDVATALFGTEQLGAIRFVSDDEFEVSSTIHAATPAGTLGQFAPGLPRSAAKRAGALLHLRSTGSPFRTNIGVVNPNSFFVKIAWTLYDRNNVRIAGNTTLLPPLGVLPPSNMSGGYFFDAGRADVSEAWVSYICDAPIFVYASVIDTGSGDQTFIPAVDDRGPNALPTRTHELDVTLEDFSITISPAPAGIRQGDTIVFHVRVKNGSHSFELFSPTPNRVILPTPPGAAADVSFIAEGEGVYIYSCANPDCGAGHVNMSGTIVVRNSDPDH